MLRRSYCPLVGAAALACVAATTGAQSNVTLSPFLAFPTGVQRMTGLALSLGGGPFALRASGQISLVERGATDPVSSAAFVARPWSADADALAYLEHITYGGLLSFSPYLFTGLSSAAIDSASTRINQRGWSYGGGLALPVGSLFGAFGEVRWRMSRYVMPQAADAPSASTEARFGLSFRVGGGGSAIPNIATGEGISVGDVIWEVLSTANRYLGTRYFRGGTSPSTGFDAAGFVRFVFARLGVNLPRTSRAQARVGDEVETDWHIIAPGDLLLFEDDGGINHVAIYAGKQRIIHSSETGGGVRYDDLSSDRGRWFMEHLVAARRVTPPDQRGTVLDFARTLTDDDSPDEPDHAPRVSGKRRR